MVRLMQCDHLISFIHYISSICSVRITVLASGDPAMNKIDEKPLPYILRAKFGGRGVEVKNNKQISKIACYMVGLPYLANKNKRGSVKFEFQVKNKIFLV